MASTGVFKLASLSKTFATRTRGKEALGNLLHSVADSTDGTFVIDWNGVNAASPSFVDEFLGGICGHIESGNIKKDLVVTADNPVIVDLINSVLIRRSCQMKYAVKPEYVSKETFILGDPEKSPPILA